MVENSFRTSDQTRTLTSPAKQPDGLLDEFLGKAPKVKSESPTLNEATLLQLTDGNHKGLHNLEFYKPLLYSENLLAQAQGVTTSDLKKVQDESNGFLQRSDFQKAIEPLRKELDILRKLDPKEEDEQFVKPFSRLAMSLREVSAGKGDKDAEKLFGKAIELIDKHPAAEGTPERRRQDVYRALIQENSGVNDILLAKSSSDPNQRKAYYEKVEKELTAALKTLNGEDFKDNPFRLRALTNLAQAEDYLGHKDAAQKHTREIKEHPLYAKSTSQIETGLLEGVIAKAKDNSPALKSVIEEMEKCPWGKLVKPIVSPEPGTQHSAQYDTQNSKIVIGDKIPEAELPQKYAFAATQAYRQQLFKLFSGDAPVDQKTYTDIQVENMVAAHKAEVQVAAQTNPGKPVTFISEDGTKHDLRSKSDQEIGALLREQKFLQRFWQDSYASYSNLDSYRANKTGLTNAKMLVEGY